MSGIEPRRIDVLLCGGLTLFFALAGVSAFWQALRLVSWNAIVFVGEIAFGCACFTLAHFFRWLVRR